jgi:hypothetical protein
LAPSTIAEAVRIWTYLLEANRVWNPKFLGGDDAGPKAKTASR